MGHYLSEMETDDEYYARAVLGPMRKTLDIYFEECRRGIIHTAEWNAKMTKYQKTLEEAGYDIDYITRGQRGH